MPERIFGIGIATQRKDSFAVIGRRFQRLERMQSLLDKHVRDRLDARPAAVRRIEPHVRCAAENREHENRYDRRYESLVERARDGTLQAVPARKERKTDDGRDYRKETEQEMERAFLENACDKARIGNGTHISPDEREREPLVHPAHDFVIGTAGKKVHARKNDRNNFYNAQPATPDSKRNCLQAESQRHDEADIGKHRVPQKTVPVGHERSARRGVAQVQRTELHHAGNDHNQREEEPVEARHGHLLLWR